MINRRPLLAIESPYKGTPEQVRLNEQFAEAVCAYAVDCGYATFAMHLLYTRFLDDQNPAERLQGFECGLSWTDLASEKWFCLRPNDVITAGMWAAIDALKDRRAFLKHFTQEGTLISSVELTPEAIATLRNQLAAAHAIGA